jgi:hypothetical protein
MEETREETLPSRSHFQTTELLAALAGRGIETTERQKRPSLFARLHPPDFIEMAANRDASQKKADLAIIFCKKNAAAACSGVNARVGRKWCAARKKRCRLCTSEARRMMMQAREEKARK